MIIPPPPSDPGRQTPDDQQTPDGSHDASGPTGSGDSRVTDASDSTATAASPPPEASSLAQPDPWQSDSYSARAEQPAYPEAGSPYAPPGSAATSYGQPTYGPSTPAQPYQGQREDGQPQYGQAQYGQADYGQVPSPSPANGAMGSPYGSGYGQPAYGASGPPAPMSQQNERTMALAAHLGALGVGVFSGGSLGWLVPLVIYLIHKDRSGYVRMHAAAALNFQIVLIIAGIASVALMVVLIGFLTIFGVIIAGLVLPILAAVAASDGRPYRYPLTPSMVK